MASDRTVVDGCGEHATPGRMKVIFESTDSSVTRASFPVAGYFIQATSEHRRPTAFSDWEWRSTASNNNRWQDPALNRIGFASGELGENIVEVRPKAGAHVWSNRNASNPIQGPGELVVQVFDLPSGSTTPYAAPGTPYFLFMGGKGCARVGPGGAATGQAARPSDLHRKVPDIPNWSVAWPSARLRSSRPATSNFLAIRRRLSGSSGGGCLTAWAAGPAGSPGTRAFRAPGRLQGACRSIPDAP